MTNCKFSPFLFLPLAQSCSHSNQLYINNFFSTLKGIFSTVRGIVGSGEAFSQLSMGILVVADHFVCYVVDVWFLK